jgi:cell division protein FtsB
MAGKKQPFSFTQLLYSRITTGLGILVFGMLSFALMTDTTQTKSVDDSILALEYEADRLAKEYSDLEDLIRYLSSDDYARTESKKKLGLVSKGEQVVIISDAEIEGFLMQQSQTTTLDSELTQLFAKQEVEKTNFQQWIEYFGFNRN